MTPGHREIADMPSTGAGPPFRLSAMGLGTVWGRRAISVPIRCFSVNPPLLIPLSGEIEEGW